MTMRVIIADDHPTVRAGVRLLLEGLQLHVAAEADSPDSLFLALDQAACDLLITDFSMPGGQEADGLALLQRIRSERPALPIVVLTMLGNVGVHGSILDSGVQGLVDKGAGTAEISFAIRAVEQGRSFVSASFKERLMQRRFSAGSGAAARLSPREIEVIRLFASGMTVSAIAQRLARSIKTVSGQKIDAMGKLGLQSDLDIYVYAREHGLAP